MSWEWGWGMWIWEWGRGWYFDPPSPTLLIVMIPSLIAWEKIESLKLCTFWIACESLTSIYQGHHN